MFQYLQRIFISRNKTNSFYLYLQVKNENLDYFITFESKSVNYVRREPDPAA